VVVVGIGAGRIWEERRKERSVKRKGSSLREGHGVERRDSEEASRRLWRGGGVGTESSKVSARSRRNGSEEIEIALLLLNCVSFVVLVLMNL
jgi:hypothetical protein